MFSHPEEGPTLFHIKRKQMRSFEYPTIMQLRRLPTEAFMESNHGKPYTDYTLRWPYLRCLEIFTSINVKLPNFTVETNNLLYYIYIYIYVLPLWIRFQVTLWFSSKHESTLYLTNMWGEHWILSVHIGLLIMILLF